MAVRWPDGSFTGSGQAGKNPPVSIRVGSEPNTEDTDDKSEKKKES